MKRIYGGQSGSIVETAIGKRVFLFDEHKNGNWYNPTMILHNKLNVEELRNYLNKVLKDWDKEV